MFEFYLFINKGGAPTVSYRVSSLLRPQAMDCEGIYPSSYILSLLKSTKLIRPLLDKLKVVKKLWFSYWKQNDTGEDSCVWDWYGEKCCGSCFYHGVSMHLYSLWNIWSKCFTCRSYNLKMKRTWNRPAKDRNDCNLKNIQFWN